jgi:Family of unknown function (DUF6279)
MASQCERDGNVGTEVGKEVLNNSAIKSAGWRRPLRGLPARIVALLAVAILVTACNTIKLGYENLPRLVEWQADRFLALDNEQEALVNRHARTLQRWHRQNLLPVYADFLTRVEEELRTPVSTAQVTAWRQTAVDGWAPLAEKLAPAVAEVALTLRPEQIDHLRKAIEKANRKTANEYLPADPVKRRQARYERLVERTASFMGDVSDAQKEAIRASAAAMAGGDDAWWQSRLARQKAIVDLLGGISREKPPMAEATRRAHQVLAGLWDHHRASSTTASAGDQLTVRLLALASPEQRRSVVKRLDGYRQDFELLAAR